MMLSETIVPKWAWKSSAKIVVTGLQSSEPGGGPECSKLGMLRIFRSLRVHVQTNQQPCRALGLLARDLCASWPEDNMRMHSC